MSALATAQRFRAELATTEPQELIESSNVDAVVIATRHNLHAQYAVAALQAGKHVFVEKPLALDEADLSELEQAATHSGCVLMVGFNRRFAPLAAKLMSAMSGHGPLMMSYRVNAGRLPRAHWTHDPHEGGGRIVGEVCHFVDFASFLCGGKPEVAATEAVTGSSEPTEDDISTVLRFRDGSVATILYSALGDPSLSKERVEVFGEQGAGILDDFVSLALHVGGRRTLTEGRRDKGHAQELAVFFDACRSSQQPWPVDEMAAVTRATFAIRDGLRGSSR
jgi:predicted dehydrogenase